MSKNDRNAMYGLSRMPFDLGLFDTQRIGREVEWRRLREVIASGRRSLSPIIGVLLGTYGSGKSFLLWHLAHSKIDGALVSKPIRLIDPEQKRDFVRNLVVRVFRRGFDTDALIEIVRAAGKMPTNIPPMARRFLPLLFALGSETTAPVAKRVLDGGRALRKEADAGGFPEATHIRTNEDAIELLFSLQVVVKLAGMEALVLTIDEVEFIDGLPRNKRPEVFDSIKHLWDQENLFFSSEGDAAQLVMILSATPAFWQGRQLLQKEARGGEGAVGLIPFFARISDAAVVEMPAELAENEARKLIVTRMSEVRKGSADVIIPFTDDYVAYVYALSAGLPRTIIEICATVMNEAHRRNIIKIDAPAAKRILRELLISYEPPTPPG